MDSYSYKVVQPALFDFSEKSTGAMELFPAVWSAAEDLVAPEAATRQSGLKSLIELGAPRLSPLIAFLVATRLTDPNLRIRKQVVQVISDVLLPDKQGRLAPEAVTRCLKNYLSQARVRLIYALLEVVSHSTEMDRHVSRLLNQCPYAGNHLSSILSDRKIPLLIRQKAAHLIGLVGFLDAIPILERLAARLEARMTGQQSMPFAPVDTTDESALLLDVRATLLVLKAA